MTAPLSSSGQAGEVGAAVALTVDPYNLVKTHSSIRMAPAMKAGLTKRIWVAGDLLAA